MQGGFTDRLECMRGYHTNLRIYGAAHGQAGLGLILIYPADFTELSINQSFITYTDPTDLADLCGCTYGLSGLKFKKTIHMK